ncbi:uncharacterized protein K452DRAFT_314462 [Aplosporella prunicola CBS 121167]|uniref:Uncharacterized protein n=1 Tax=Aplosporella prunicola CBS 121167 TaxID=1176127 RepID=A0A6A6BX16_9PEZI|nr:uncharacterized protein K452DRAFT_314462 [Aplosporella prunicola CBS 121167]KAF2147261.1 hypothetical protein K452DRAFT_314462 [Aplosporella prunicola CBS 121167]
MAPNMEIEAYSKTDVAELQQALQTAQLELDLERSHRIVEGVARDEDIRKLRCQILLLEDENDELHDQLAEEESRADRLEGTLDDSLEQLKVKEAEVLRLQNELRVKARASDTMKAELAALESISTDSNKVLAEKLALAHEVRALKPELEHLRSQADVHANLISEKLSLQRQLDTVEVELENEKRATQRAIARQGKASEKDAEHQSEVSGLRKELSKAMRELEKAEKELDKVQLELDSTRKAAERAQSKEDKKTAQDAKDDAKLEDLKKELAKEKREREKAEKAIEKSRVETEAQTTLVNERADAYKNKLKSVKEKLKETQAELQKAQAAAAAQPVIEEAQAPKAAPAKNPRKRTVAQLDQDATTLGTPGDGMPAKRSRATIMPGEKSTFSITPFLNRTANVIEDTPKEQAEDAEVEHDDQDSAEAQGTPTVQPKKGKKAVSEKPKTKALAALDANQKAKPAAQRKKAAAPALEKVAEEADSDDQENSPVAEEAATKLEEPEKPKEKGKKAKQAEKESEPTSLKPKLKPASAARKSLASFASFMDEGAPEKKKKKRKLGGNQSILGKTLFDVDEEEETSKPAKPIPGRGIFAARALGKGRLGGPFAGAKSLGAGPTMTTVDGFTFSPRKKEKKAMREASMMQ